MNIYEVIIIHKGRLINCLMDWLIDFKYFILYLRNNIKQFKKLKYKFFPLLI